MQWVVKNNAKDEKQTNKRKWRSVSEEWLYVTSKSPYYFLIHVKKKLPVSVLCVLCQNIRLAKSGRSGRSGWTNPVDQNITAVSNCRLCRLQGKEWKREIIFNLKTWQNAPECVKLHLCLSKFSTSQIPPSSHHHGVRPNFNPNRQDSKK